MKEKSTSFVLGIETSCDETGVAIYEREQGLLANVLYSQIDLHVQYGGVVPELASRDHIRRLAPLLHQALREANLTLKEIDGVAYTAGPGLIGAVLVGAAFARSLAFGLGVPAIGVHHLEAHLLAPLLETEKPALPFLALLVSGGHTMLIAVHALGKYEILGETIDDAVGEAFDKTAKILGLPYPGGAALANLAVSGDATRFHFPRPMLDRPGLDFSFSGLKTHALHVVQKASHDPQTYADIARAFEDAVVDTLAHKCRRALARTGMTRLVAAGGVAANQALRRRLAQEVARVQGEVYFPRLAYCTDNAAMVALTGSLRLQSGYHHDLSIQVRARWPLEELSSILD